MECNRLCEELIENSLLFNSVWKGKRSKRVSHLICVTTVWCIWLEKNDVLLNGKVANISEVVDHIIRGSGAAIIYIRWHFLCEFLLLFYYLLVVLLLIFSVGDVVLRFVFYTYCMVILFLIKFCSVLIKFCL